MRSAAVPQHSADARRIQAVAWVNSLGPLGHGHAERSKILTLELLKRAPDPFDRADYQLGHITASAIVLSADAGRVLLVFHKRLGAWLQPGGHVDPGDPDVFAAALREVGEETGAKLRPCNRPKLLAADVHDIPASGGEPTHVHHDLVFRLVARSDELGPSPEARAVMWYGIDKLAEVQVDDSLQRNVERAIRAT